MNGTSIHLWLVVSTPLKNINQLGWLFPISWKIKNVPNHQPDLKIAHVWHRSDSKPSQGRSSQPLKQRCSFRSDASRRSAERGARMFGDAMGTKTMGKMEGLTNNDKGKVNPWHGFFWWIELIFFDMAVSENDVWPRIPSKIAGSEPVDSSAREPNTPIEAGSLDEIYPLDPSGNL